MHILPSPNAPQITPEDKMNNSIGEFNSISYHVTIHTAALKIPWIANFPLMPPANRWVGAEGKNEAPAARGRSLLSSPCHTRQGLLKLDFSAISELLQQIRREHTNSCAGSDQMLTQSHIQHPTAITSRYPGRGVKMEQAHSDAAFNPPMGPTAPAQGPKQEGMCVFNRAPSRRVCVCLYLLMDFSSHALVHSPPAPL